MTNKGPRPWEADTLRDYIQFRVLQERISHIGPCTPGQASIIAQLMGEFFTSRLDRLSALSYLIQRNVESSKALNKSEATVIIAWLKSADHDATAEECARVLRARLKTEGQQELNLTIPLDKGHRAHIRFEQDADGEWRIAPSRGLDRLREYHHRLFDDDDIPEADPNAE